jgi:putative ABC transport system permease protein
MSHARLVKHSLRAMSRYKLRSGFMMLGSLVGVAALTLVLSIGEAAERKILATVRQLFGESSILLVAGGGRMMGGPRAGAARLTIEDVEALARDIPAIAAWDPQRVLPGTPVRHGDASATTRVTGQSERSERVWDRGVSRGEYFDTAAVAGSARVALIGETVVRELFGSEDPLGAEMLIGSVRFRVVGVLEPLGTDAHGMDRDDEVVVPISTAMSRLTNVDTIHAAKMLVKDPSTVEETAGEIRRLLRERHSIASGQPDDFNVITPIQVRKMVGQVQKVTFLYLPLVAAISLLAGGVVAASLMLASVNARVGEIGLRRAVGARPRDIHLQFLLETAVTTLGGGVLGLLIGSGVAQFVASRMSLGGVLSGKAFLVGIAAAAVTGFLAGVVPARRAARLQPADALR